MLPQTQNPLALLHLSFVIILLITASLGAAIFALSIRAHQDEGWVEHTLQTRNQIAELTLLVQRAETSQRGYLITGKDEYLDPYRGAAEALPRALDFLTELCGDNPIQVGHIRDLRPLVRQKLDELGSTIEERKQGHADAAVAIVNRDTGLRLMEQIRGIATEMEAEENRLLAVRQARSSLSANLLKVAAGIAFLFICGIGLLVSLYTKQAFRELTAARDSLALTNHDLVKEKADRERVEAQLRQAQKMEAIGQLTGGVAHDFNNMLGVIIGSLELVQRRLKKSDFAIDRFVEAAQAAAERAATLTQRLLAFARKQPLAPQVFDTNKMIANMSELLRSTIGEQIRIETVLAGGLWHTKADPHQLENAIINVAVNARDAMPEGGKLTIETANAYLDEAYSDQHLEVAAGQYVMIAVSDTGTGMPSDILQRAFDPFFTTKAAGRGTGLGLSQVYGFIKQSGGHIKIYSEVGSGSSVKMYLPRFVGIAPDHGFPLRKPIQTAIQGEAILVVEDDPLMRRLTVEALRELGYLITECQNGHEALSVLSQSKEFRMLLTDIVMPEISGKKLADEATRIRPDLKVLFTTGYTQNAVVHGGVLDPGVQFLSKPFALDQLAAKVRSVLDS